MAFSGLQEIFRNDRMDGLGSIMLQINQMIARAFRPGYGQVSFLLLLFVGFMFINA